MPRSFIELLSKTASKTVKCILCIATPGALMLLYDVATNKWTTLLERMQMMVNPSLRTARLSDDSFIQVYWNSMSMAAARLYPHRFINNTYNPHLYAVLQNRTDNHGTSYDIDFTASGINSPIHTIPVTLLNDDVIFFNRTDEKIVSPTSIFRPSTNEWRIQPEGRTVYDGACCVVLLSGKVLISGGEEEDEGYMRECEIYDPDLNSFRRVGSMNMERVNHGGCLLPNGNVFVHGGEAFKVHGHTYSVCEEYDIAKDRWSMHPRTTPHYSSHSCILLGTERIAFIPLTSNRTMALYNLSTNEMEPMDQYPGMVPDYRYVIPLYERIVLDKQE
jgi:hypothetical protein